MSSLPPFNLRDGMPTKSRHRRENSQTRYDMGKLRAALAAEHSDEHKEVSFLPMGKDEFKKRFAVTEEQTEKPTAKKRQPSRMLPSWEDAAPGSAQFAVGNPFASAGVSSQLGDEEESEVTVSPRKALHRVPRMNSLEDFFSQMGTGEVEMEMPQRSTGQLSTILEGNEQLDEADE